MYILSKSGYQYFFFAFIISSVLCKNTDSLKYSIVSDKGWRVKGLNVKNTESQLKSIFKMIYIILGGFRGISSCYSEVCYLGTVLALSNLTSMFD